MGLMCLEGRLYKIRYIDVFLYKKYFWLFPEIISSWGLLTQFDFIQNYKIQYVVISIIKVSSLSFTAILN